MSAAVPKLELRQGQSLLMTQQLQQSIRLLQMSSQEIMEFVELEVEKNPLLEIEQEEDDEPIIPDEKPAEPDNEEENPITPIEESFSETESFDFEQYEPRIKTINSDNDIDDFESFTATDITLHDFLLEQLGIVIFDPVKRIIGQHLIDMVDESGYIREDTSFIEELLDCSKEIIQETFAILHSLEPIGVCARNLKECLSIQLKEKNRLDPAMLILLEHLNLVANQDFKQLSKICELGIDDIKQMCLEVKELNPRPGSGFNHEKVQAIVPDVFLRRINGNWHIELNQSVLPRVLVNRNYFTKINSKSQKPDEKKYISEQMGIANWLVKALDSRAQTMLKVSSELVKRQESFFLFGIKELRPLTLKEVAESVELHESTISRVTTNKFIQTPRGTYELKYFFSAALSNNFGGTNYSSKTVQFMIKELIEKEESNAVLSDDIIAEKLKYNGIDVARRTVAKYRELLKIPTSSIRKREKAKSA
ncbi:MAG: RNA polymerase factor sigma-54 [Pseudomonadota bacterium]